MTWTQNVCQRCWYADHPYRTPVRVKDTGTQVCCKCGARQQDGIFIRIDPQTVPFPREMTTAEE